MPLQDCRSSGKQGRELAEGSLQDVARHPLPAMGAMLTYAARDGQVIQAVIPSSVEKIHVVSVVDGLFSSFLIICRLLDANS